MKKLIAVLSMILVVCLASFAIAEEVVVVPSKTTEDMAQVVSVVAVSGQPLPADFAIQKIEDEEVAAAIAETAQTQLAEISTFVQENNKPVVEYFGEKTTAQITAKMPEVKTEKLVMNEFVPVVAKAYQEDIGDVVTEMKFATEFKADQKVFVLVGIENENGEIEWVVLDAVVANGSVVVTFTEDVLKRINGKPALMAVLSEEA